MNKIHLVIWDILLINDVLYIQDTLHITDPYGIHDAQHICTTISKKLKGILLTLDLFVTRLCRKQQLLQVDPCLQFIFASLAFVHQFLTKQ